jgi:hypothetical protein
MEIKTLFDLSPFIMASVPVIVALVSVVKRTINLSDRYAPLVSLFFGVLIALIVGEYWQVIIIQGILAGLMASGLYSGGKALIKG